jgi:hypothetical protein
MQRSRHEPFFVSWTNAGELHIFVIKREEFKVQEDQYKNHPMVWQKEVKGASRMFNKHMKDGLCELSHSL